jgi:hypothetical protein
MCGSATSLVAGATRSNVVVGAYAAVAVAKQSASFRDGGAAICERVRDPVERPRTRVSRCSRLSLDRAMVWR